MTEFHKQGSRVSGFVPSIVISTMAGYLSAPSLLEAWSHDSYSRGGPAAFGIWILVLAGVFLLPRGNGNCHGVSWIMIAAACCAAGSMADLRVLHHLALACSLTGLAGMGLSGLLSVAAALAWMPAAGWFLSRFFPGGLVGWERPAAVLAGCFVVSIAALRGKPLLS